MAGTLNVRTRLRPSESPSVVYAALATRMPQTVLIAFGGGVLRELSQELHSWEAVARWAADLAVRLNRPVLLNVPTGDGSSQTVALAPGWTQERFAGYLVVRREEIAAAFGPINQIAHSTHNDAAEAR